MPTDQTLLAAAVDCGDYASVLRLARERAGWSQTELARRLGSHPSMISRYESRRRALRDPDTLRQLAHLLDLPVTAFGLCERTASGRNPVPAPRVSSNRDLEEDPMRRRTFLAAGGVLGAGLLTTSGGGAAGAEFDPAVLLRERLKRALLGQLPGRALPQSVPMLRQGLFTAHAAFDRADYHALAGMLPGLAVDAQACTSAAGTDEIRARIFNLVTRVLIKLPASELEWVAVDRACHAAETVSDPLVNAEAQRLKASVCRRAGHHDLSQELVLAAAGQLAIDRRAPAPGELAMHAGLMSTAAYGAARAGNRDLALDLLAAADGNAARLTEHRALHEPVSANIISHRVSVHHVLGDPAAALHHARTAGTIRFPSTERQGRFLVDIALAHHALDRHGPAYNALREAEQRAAGEVRTRSTARRLIAELRAQRRVHLPGIDELAARAHV